MQVTLGDGRTVEAPRGIRRMPAGPNPAVYEAERCRPMTVRARRNEDEARPAPFAVFLHSGSPPESPDVG